MKVLVLAGTTEASALLRLLSEEPEIEVVAAFAGHTAAPSLPPCPVLVGGFGGVDGLRAVLRRERFDALVDATHPFSSTMPVNAASAAAAAGVPHLRLVRPPWLPATGDSWELVDDIGAAVASLRARAPTCALITVGRLGVGAFREIASSRLVVRSIGEPDPALLAREAVVVTGRGPFTFADELDLMRRYHIDVLVTKNSGGDDAKLRAARTRGVTVLMIRRPSVDVPVGAVDAEEARRWVQRLRSGS